MHTFRRQRWLSLVALGLGLASPLTLLAEPWISPGDVRLRHDLQQLSDQGLLTGPTMSWPMGWSQVARELGAIEVEKIRFRRFADGFASIPVKPSAGEVNWIKPWLSERSNGLPQTGISDISEWRKNLFR